jgi:16S rRNA (uracil1498-N3)-methyltransferase
MTHQRFFVSPDAILNGHVAIQGQQAHQIARVLRLVTGDEIVVLDDSGCEYVVHLDTVRGAEVTGTIIEVRDIQHRPRVLVTLFQSLLKAEKFELVLQKGTELGAATFQPVLSERCVARVEPSDQRRLDRWARIVTEAAEQSRRTHLPQLRPPVPLPEAAELADAFDILLIFWEEEHVTRLYEALTTRLQHAFSGQPVSVGVFIGPEGGFTEAEVERVRAHGGIPVSLGRNILRAETAAIAALAAVFFGAGELG